MRTNPDIVIIGAGPGGLACAKHLAEHGQEVLVLERKTTIGPKVCAGGITWSGLLRHVPEALIERAFPKQHVISNLQRIEVVADKPIVATVNREKLGQWMAQAARNSGATIETGIQVKEINKSYIIACDQHKKLIKIPFKHLVGADGASSMVRRFLGIPTEKMAIGINYQIPGRCKEMEWHLNTRMFGSGYGWIFPHRETISIGAYGDQHNMNAAKLKKQLLAWAAQQGYDLAREQPRAALVNYDFQGFAFQNFWLVGDAAGLASGLTGEGIYPAIVSGEAVARKIIDPVYPADEIKVMAKKQKQHQKVIRIASRHPLLCSLLMEWLVFLLRIKLLDFHALEMAD